MARHALTMGAAVFAAVPVVISPLTVSAASPMTPQEWMDYYNVSTSDVVIGALWTDEFFPVYYTMIMNVVQLPYINGVPIEPGSLNLRAGYYYRNGERHRGCVTLWARRIYQNGGNSGELPLFAGDDCSISVTVEPMTGNTSQQYYIDYTVDNSSMPQLYIASALSRRDMRVTVSAPGFTNSVPSYTFSGAYYNSVYLGRIAGSTPVEISSDVSGVLAFGGYPSNQLLGEAVTLPAFPTADGYETITQENALDYVENVLNPWAVEQSPDIEPYLLTEPVPAPTYPVQETWNNDADWPEGNLLPTIPAASYTVDIPEIMTEGASFWWRCLGVLFDGLGITAVIVGLLALGIVLYFVLR